MSLTFYSSGNPGGLTLIDNTGQNRFRTYVSGNAIYPFELGYGVPYNSGSVFYFYKTPRDLAGANSSTSSVSNMWTCQLCYAHQELTIKAPSFFYVYDDIAFNELARFVIATSSVVNSTSSFATPYLIGQTNVISATKPNTLYSSSIFSGEQRIKANTYFLFGDQSNKGRAIRFGNYFTKTAYVNGNPYVTVLDRSFEQVQLSGSSGLAIPRQLGNNSIPDSSFKVFNSAMVMYGITFS